MPPALVISAFLARMVCFMRLMSLPLALIAVDDADHIAEAIRARGGLEKL